VPGPTPTRSGTAATWRGIPPAHRGGDCATALLPGSIVRMPPLSPTSTDGALGAV